MLATQRHSTPCVQRPDGSKPASGLSKLARPPLASVLLLTLHQAWPNRVPSRGARLSSGGRTACSRWERSALGAYRSAPAQPEPRPSSKRRDSASRLRGSGSCGCVKRRCPMGAGARRRTLGATGMPVADAGTRRCRAARPGRGAVAGGRGRHDGTVHVAAFAYCGVGALHVRDRALDILGVELVVGGEVWCPRQPRRCVLRGRGMVS